MMTLPDDTLAPIPSPVTQLCLLVMRWVIAAGGIGAILLLVLGLLGLMWLRGEIGS